MRNLILYGQLEIEYGSTLMRQRRRRRARRGATSGLRRAAGRGRSRASGNSGRTRTRTESMLFGRSKKGERRVKERSCDGGGGRANGQSDLWPVNKIKYRQCGS